MRGKWMFLLILGFAVFCAAVRAQQAGQSGVTVGTVREVTEDYVMVAVPGDAPHRHYFKWVDVRGAAPDQAMLAAALKLKHGDRVEVHWTYDDRLRIEKLEAAPPEVSSVATAAPTLAPVAQGHDGLTTGEKVNFAIDNLMATGERLLELPLFMVLGAVAVAGGMIALMIGWVTRKGRVKLARGLYGAAGVLVVLVIAFVLDRKISRLQEEVAALRAAASSSKLAMLNAEVPPRAPAAVSHEAAAGKREAFLVDMDMAKKSLAAEFQGISLKPAVYDQAMDVVQIHANMPLVQGYLAVVDLRDPRVGVQLGGTLEYKTLTSAFARDNQCTLAINGEAGMSPAPGSGLGVWRGNWMKAGDVLLREDARIQRPFLVLDRKNHAGFVSAGEANRALPSEAYNVVWGRLDAVVKGVVQTGDERNRQPRTAMGISRDGERLYLLVVDGRQPNYSMGFTRAEVGQCLAAFGAYDGMLCDEGGSSCMYLQQLDGIANIPSDGQERATYTHFGISLKNAE